MKTLPLKLVLEDASALAEVARVIEQGGLVCAPCTGAYRILADLNNEDAVSRLLQSKRRTGRAPSLVFVADAAMLGQVAAEISPLARRLVKAMWPGPLTILFEPHAELPAAVVKQLCKSSGKIGVRVPADPLAQALVRAARSWSPPPTARRRPAPARRPRCARTSWGGWTCSWTRGTSSPAPPPRSWTWWTGSRWSPARVP